MDVSPQFRTVDQLATTAIAIEQPLALLLENGPAFSLLLAARASSVPHEGAMTLEDCVQVRIEADGETALRKFPHIRIKREPKHLLWIASPDRFASYFSQPSKDPYILLELTKSQSRNLNQAIRRRDFDAVFEIARERFSQLPKFFSPTALQLRTPENYAAGRNCFPKTKRFL